MLLHQEYYTYSTLDEVAFAPENIIGLDLIYNKNKYELRFEDKYYSAMYDTNQKLANGTMNTFRNELDGYNILNWYNTYKFSDSLELGFNIQNLLGADTEYKSGYPLADRKYVLEVKINY